MNRFFLFFIIITLLSCVLLCSCSDDKEDAETAAVSDAETSGMLPNIPEEALPWDDFDDEDGASDDAQTDAAPGDDADAQSPSAVSSAGNAPSADANVPSASNGSGSSSQNGSGAASPVTPPEIVDTFDDATGNASGGNNPTAPSYDNGGSNGNAIDLPIDYD